MTSVTQTQVLASSAAPDRRTYALTAGTELLGEYQDSAYQEPKYLIQRVDGQTMQLPRLLYGVASSLRGHDARQIADEVNADLGQDLTEDQVRFLVEERLFPAGIVAMDGQAPEGADGGEATQPRAEPAAVPMPVRSDLLLALRYRAGVIPARVAARIGGALQPLFARPVWMALVTAFLAVDAAIIVGGDLLDRSVAGVQAVIERPALMLAILGVTVLSGAIHEFGHITACRYGGARPGNVGVGLYIVWPAFYSDVTDSYRLDRVGRLRTDLGGVYFDAVVMAALGLVYLRTGEPWLFIALIGMHVETAWQFLPSIRLDGYYILADLVGVPDLFGYVRPVLLGLLPGRPTHPKVLALKTRARRLIALWVAAAVPCIVVWTALVAIALPRLLPAAWRAVREYLTTLDAAARAGNLLTTTVGVTELALLVLPWVGGALVLWSTIRLVAGHLTRRTALRRVPATTWAAVRRALALALLAGTGVLLVARIAQVTLSHPGTTGEVRLAESALAAARGVPGPGTGAGEVLARLQLTLYAELTGAYGRHASVLAAGREIVVVAAAVLVSCLVALVVTRRLPPAAAALPLVAVLAMGPAVTTLATLAPGTLGTAWVAVGAVVLTLARGRIGMLAGLGAVTAGVATAPLVALPLAVGIGVLLGWGRSGRDRRAGDHEGPRH